MSQAESDHDAVSDVCEKSSWNVFKKGDENLEESTRNMMKMMELLSESKNVIREMMEDRWKLKKEIEELKKQTKVKKMIPEKQKKSKKLEETQSERENERPPLKAHDSSNLQVECKPKESLEINKKIECLQNQLKSLEILSEKQKLHEKELESQRKLIEKYTFMRQKTMKKDVKMKKKKNPFSHTISQRLTDPTNYTVQCPSLVKSCEWRNIPLRRPSQENFVPFEKKPSENCSKHIFLKPKNNFFGENNVHQDVSSSNIKNLEKLCSERKMAQKSEECALPKNFKDLYLKKPLHSAPRITFSLQNESFNNKNNNALDSNCHLPEKFQNGFYPGLERTSKKEDDKTDGEVTEKDERKVASATSDQDSDGHLHVASGNKSPKRKIDKMKKNVFKNKKNLKMNKLEKMVEKQKCELKSPRRDGVPPSEQSDIQVLQQKQMLENFLISKVCLFLFHFDSSIFSKWKSSDTSDLLNHRIPTNVQLDYIALMSFTTVGICSSIGRLVL